MRLEVFSNPVWGVSQARPISGDDLANFVMYDEAIVKPALLIADEVVLRTWRLDVQGGVALQAAAVGLAVPLQHIIEAFVDRHSSEERDLLGIDPDLYRDIRESVERFGRRKDLADKQFFASEAIIQFAKLKSAFHRQQYDALSASHFKPLIERGVLIESAWDDRPKRSFVEADFEFRENALTYGWLQMVNALETGESAVLLDQGIQERLSDTGLRDAYRSTTILENAANLMRIIDGLSTAPLDEVADLRLELSDFIAPFRSFILYHASGMDLSPDASLGEKRRVAELKWNTEVSPAIRELEGKVRSSSFVKNAVDVVSEGPEAAIGVGLGLTTALASGAIHVTALAGLGVAALPTIIKAAATTAKSKSAARRDAAYFVWRAERQLAGRRA